MSKKTETNKTTDESEDRKFFTITPRLVWALSRDPYDYILWSVIKDVASENGECYIATPDLATMTMMSVGKLDQCRKYLIKAGLLKGEVRRDPGYPQPVWHLSIPNIWKENIEWCLEHPKIHARLEFKREQAKQVKQAKKRSSGESSQHSPHENPPPPHENPPPPRETKKNQEEEGKEEIARETAARVPHNPQPENTPSQPFVDALNGMQAPLQLFDYPPDVQEVVGLVWEFWGLDVPEKPRKGEKGGEYALWIKDARALAVKVGDHGKREVLSRVHGCWNNNPWTVSHPGALLSAVASEVGKLNLETRRSASTTPTDQRPGSFAAVSKAGTWVPNPNGLSK